MKLNTGLAMAALAGAGALLAGCADEKGMDREFKSIDMTGAVHEDMAAQIADPDAAYKGPPPPSNGARAEAAMKRYETGAIISPQPASSMTNLNGGGGGGGQGGGGPQ